MALISIIVACHNRAVFLGDTIQSVQKQDYRDWELILVDDGSQDRTWEVIQQHMEMDERIRGFRKSNEGPAKTRNYGAAKSCPSSRYLFFLDDDDQLEPQALGRLSSYLDQHPEVGLVGCQLRDIDTAGRRLETGRRSRWAPGRLFPHQMRDDEIETPFVVFFCATGQGPFAMYRKSVYQQTEGWDPAFWPHEDTDMFCQMALLSKVHFLPDRLYLKRGHLVQVMKDAQRIQDAYSSFRAKWDRRLAQNDQEAHILNHAKSYYYSTHRPLRDLKVARKALGEFLWSGRLASLRWCLHLVFSALYGGVVYRWSFPSARHHA